MGRLEIRDDMTSNEDQVTALLEWCAANSAFIDSRIEIRGGSEELEGTGMNGGVYSKDSFISPNITLAKIPKDAILSVRTCSLAEHMSVVPYGIGAQLSLSLALYVEILRGNQSRWDLYLRCLPHGLVDLPLFWDLHSNSDDTSNYNRYEDGSVALAWLSGTEAAKLLHCHTDNGSKLLVGSIFCYHPHLGHYVGTGTQWLSRTETKMPCFNRIFLPAPTEIQVLQGSTVIQGLGYFMNEEINSFYYDSVQPLLLRHIHVWRSVSAETPTLSGFHRAFSLVSSRAFLVDAYHGLSMVPIADAFNHVVENHVHLESDYNVCSECGSLHECPHDRDQGGPHDKYTDHVHKGDNSNLDYDRYYEMVSNAGILPHSEIYNTYGETLSNAQLLNQYGFILDVNENDRLTWSFHEVLGTLHYKAMSNDEPYIERIRLMFQGCLQRLTKPVWELISQSELVYCETTTYDLLCLNDEGKISMQLWALLFSVALQREKTSKSTDDELYRILDLQLTLEALEKGGNDNDNDAEMHETYDPTSLNTLLEIGRSVMLLCTARKRNGGKPGSFECDLSDLMEELSEERPRTRLALSVLISERSILDSCEAGWGALVDYRLAMTGGTI